MGKKEEKKRISIGAIDNVLGNAPGIFKLTDIAAQLNAPGDDELLKRLEKLIDGVKAKISIDKVSDALGALKKLF